MCVTSPLGLLKKARELVDPGSSASFILNCLTKLLCLPQSQYSTTISGVVGLTHAYAPHPVARFCVSSCNHSDEGFDISTIIVPQVNCELPTHTVPLDPSWRHLEGLQLADRRPNPIDLLLGVDVFAKALSLGRQIGPSSSLMAPETTFGWMLAGSVDQCPRNAGFIMLHVSLSGDDLLRQFWEMEKAPSEVTVMEKVVGCTAFQIHSF